MGGLDCRGGGVNLRQRDLVTRNAGDDGIRLLRNFPECPVYHHAAWGDAEGFCAMWGHQRPTLRQGYPKILRVALGRESGGGNGDGSGRLSKRGV